VIDPAKVPSEAERIRKAYREARKAVPRDLYCFMNPDVILASYSRDITLLAGLRRFVSLDQFRQARILDLGCGTGTFLGRLLQYGAEPSLITGLDLLPESLDKAQQRYPHVPLVCGDGSLLPFRDNSFDIVWQSTVFTSILHDSTKRQMAREMVRVLKPGGYVWWYDFMYNNPRNPDVKGIKPSEIRQLFPHTLFWCRKCVLAPPLARLLAPYSVKLCQVLEWIPWLRTHCVAILKVAK